MLMNLFDGGNLSKMKLLLKSGKFTNRCCVDKIYIAYILRVALLMLIATLLVIYLFG